MSKRPQGNLMLRVALVSDTHVNEREDFSTSPYPANALANARARYVFAWINQTRPAFTIHLGDMINPIPELPSYGEAVNCFRDIAASLNNPLHLMPGNHDIGDKPVSWMPAGVVDKHSIDTYRKFFGTDYYSFDHSDCHFIILNSSLINTNSAHEARQRQWLENDLSDNAEARIFIFTHYPPYIFRTDEPGSYDNLNEPGRSWLLNLIDAYEPEALFAAHVHNFWYDHIGKAEYYILPSTSFVRHDYSELYRIDGGDQQGRNDVGKLGHVTLDIYEHGHVARYHRSYGRTLAEGERLKPEIHSNSLPHSKTSHVGRIYVDMRHDWAEELTIAPSGAVDEFRRKWARNDYPIMTMWEMGLLGMRIPIQDLENPSKLQRMQIMESVGHNFHVYCYGLPDDDQMAALKKYRGLISQLEIVINWNEIDKLTPSFDRLKTTTGVPLILSRVNRNDLAKHSSGRFNHLISHGFGLDELDELAQFLGGNSRLVDGIQFTISRNTAPWPTARALEKFASTADCKSFLYVKSNDASPADCFNDDNANAMRFGEAVLAGIGFDVSIIIDTLDDIDRGYFTRTGLVDRRFNPRLAGKLITQIAASLAGRDWKACESDLPSVIDNNGNVISLAYGRKPVPGAKTWLCPDSGRHGNLTDTDTPAGPLLIFSS